MFNGGFVYAPIEVIKVRLEPKARRRGGAVYGTLAEPGGLHD